MTNKKEQELVLVFGDGETWEVVNEDMEIGLVEYDADLEEDGFFPIDDVTSAIKWRDDNEEDDEVTYIPKLTGKDLLNWVYGAIFSKDNNR